MVQYFSRLSMKHFVAWTAFIFLLVAPASCAVPPSADRSWAYADLRLLVPPRDGLDPAEDLLAVYTRDAGFDVQIRMDFLDLDTTPTNDIYIALNTKPGGPDSVFLSPTPFAAAAPADLTPTALQWDTLLVIPAVGQPQAFSAGEQTPLKTLLPRVVRDPGLDTVTISLNSTYLPEPFKLQIFITPHCNPQAGPCDPHPVNQTPSVSSDAPPPQARAAVLLALWDSLPAYTPAQALRRWNGAHTGPNGGRHGLELVLDAAEQERVPLALLDLKTPASLAALNILGGIPQVRRMAERGLLILPDAAFADPPDISINFSRRAASGFDLPESQFVYAASSSLQPGFLAQFIPLTDATHISRAGGTRLIPLPAPGSVQATADGPTLDLRRVLIDTALSGDPSRLVVLGGDLPSSTWGNADAAAATFSWIASHPWIQPLNGDDLFTFPTAEAAPLLSQISPTAALPVYTSGGTPSGLDSTQVQNLLRSSLPVNPQNPVEFSAWQAYLTLTAPGADAPLRALRSQYLWQVHALEDASVWSRHPFTQAGCFAYPNYTQQSECILANDRVYAVFEPEGARLTQLFSIDQNGLHQLVAPSSQFVVGLSDPSEWHPELGEGADPSVIPGAFTDSMETWTSYQVSASKDSLTFTSPDGNQIKTFRLTGNGLEVSYHLTGPITTSVPLAVDPWAFFSGPSSYSGTAAPGSWTWGLENGSRVEVRSDASLSAVGFTDSLPLLTQPENPEQDYPPGHYLPFPLSVVTLSADGDFNVWISIK